MEGRAVMRRLLLSLAVMLLAVTSVALALTRSERFDILWYTIDGGSVDGSKGGSFALSGSVGQPDAGSSQGGEYAVRGGFWGLPPESASLPEAYQVYLPLIRR
jgi:hypothetical protein